MYYDFLCKPTLVSHNLEENLKILSSKDNVKSLIKKAKNSPQFWDTLSEIEILALFERNKILEEIEPEIDGKTPDGTINLNGNIFSLEIFTPTISSKLDGLLGLDKVVHLNNRLKGATGKLAEKIEQIPSSIPTIFVINGSYSELDFFDLDEAVDGTILLQLSFNTETGKVVNENNIHKDDGLISIPDSNLISSVIMYKRTIEIGLKLITQFIINNFNAASVSLNGIDNKLLNEIFNGFYFSLH
ncbi:MAG: hypothetical protein ABSB40_07265 [Nitrososphaeria archaeon]